ncbi:restriction endonuclease type II-like protein [Amylostereum chailletii]|nr:restriction endonuclease type II-like protein [Amylostereum chailletii]
MASTSGPSKPKPPVVQPGTGNNIIVNPTQRLNPVLECIRNVGKEFGEIVADYQVGRTTGVLYLSLRYHRLHPEYIHGRIEKLGRSYNLRVLLIMCDVSEHQDLIRELTKTCLINEITVIVAWSAEEAGQYLGTFKRFEHKPPNLIRERVEREPGAIMRAALTGISKVNKTDVETLRTSFGSFAQIARASSDQLSQLPGFGPKKVARMKDAFERPFRNGATSALRPSQTASTSNNPNPNGKERDTPFSLPPLLKDKGKGKPTAAIDAEELSSPSPPRLPHTDARKPQSPVWDIELDLNSPSPPPPGRSESTAKKRDREPSPLWDIELDLNPDDIDLETEREGKRRKGS